MNPDADDRATPYYVYYPVHNDSALIKLENPANNCAR